MIRRRMGLEGLGRPPLHTSGIPRKLRKKGAHRRSDDGYAPLAREFT
jgi:hypothetical protein